MRFTGHAQVGARSFGGHTRAMTSLVFIRFDGSRSVEEWLLGRIARYFLIPQIITSLEWDFGPYEPDSLN